MTPNYPGWSEFDLFNNSYMIALYFTVTTVSTIGYGDLEPNSIDEMIYCIFLMLFGVTLFTFISGALSSILQNYDN